MGKILIVNGSPRASRSNSKKYAELFVQYWEGEAEYYLAVSKKHQTIYRFLAEYDALLFVFPLYADGIPAIILDFLVSLENCPVKKKPRIHVLINCGFLEPQQNAVAVDMVRLFCKQNNFPFGSVLCIGSGEAILTTPFAFLVKRRIKQFARAVRANSSQFFQVSMPLPKTAFVKASEKYWLRLGQKNKVSRKQMETMEIEDGQFLSPP